MSEDAQLERRPSHWGETEGGHVDVQHAEAEFRRWQSRESQHLQPVSQDGTQEPTKRSSGTSESSNETAADDSWLGEQLRHRQNLWQSAGLEPLKALAVTFQDLTVKGYDTQTSFAKTLPVAIWRTFGPQALDTLLDIYPKFRNVLPFQPPVRRIISGVTGAVKEGEMLLVLGKPGAGCSTFLKTLAHEWSGFLSVKGDLHYNGMPESEVKRKFKGELAYAREADEHFPQMTVEQTLDFALRMKVPNKRPADSDEYASREAFIKRTIDMLLKIFSIEHTRNTPVGNEMVPGCSGGERKRVSIAETLCTDAALSCWDGSSRGLDSSTATEFIRSLRVMTDVSNRTTVATLYQASENIYELFDKVMVVNAGRCIYFGSAKTARAYFAKLGFKGPDRQTTPDFLTAVTDPKEMPFDLDFQGEPPITAEAQEKAWKESDEHKQLLQEVERLNSSNANDDKVATFKRATRQDKSPMIRKSSPYTISSPAALKNLIQRQFLLKYAEPGKIYRKTFTNVSVALIVGSLFYGSGNEADDPTSAGAFKKGGAIFLSLLFLGWLELAEIFEAVGGRVIISRQAGFAFYRPGFVALARVLVDIPLIAVQATLWSIIFYFMAQLHRSASAFFVYYLFVTTQAIVLSAFFKAVAALSPNFDTAIRFSVLALGIAIIYVGYVIPRPSMNDWFGWITWIQPLSFSFEALMANEFSRYSFECAPSTTIPNLPGADPANQVCAIAGAQPGSLLVNGADYIQANFSYSYSHVWRNFGIVIAYGVGYVIAAAVFSELIDYGKQASGLVFARKRGAGKPRKEQLDTEKQLEGKKGASLRRPSREEKQMSNKNETVEGIEPSSSIFTFQDICFTVDTPDGPKQLLDNVTGYVKPYEVTALMGSSGAGKTTLLNTLSLRQPGGVTGDVLVDGKEVPTSFARNVGFAEQMDVHDASQTVREAVEFSALLRQSSEVPKEEKLAYVQSILDLLELDSLGNALVGSLDVEASKRLTIAVELAARPKLLTFLDEPTSGLDSMGAMSIGRFVRRLANSGQACLATIHQPSSELLTECFDRVLLLARGGAVSYQGPVSKITDYFESHGARKCGKSENVAEYALEVVSEPGATGKPWPEVWKESDECEVVRKEVARIIEERRPQPPVPDDGRQFAASTWEQTKLLTIRIGKHFYRDASYAYGKLAAGFLFGIFNSFTFYQLDYGADQLQQAAFSTFLVIMLLPALANASIPKHFELKAYWQIREAKSRTYDWVALMTAILVNEMPYALLMTVVYYVLAYFPTGFPLGEPAGIYFLAVLFFNIFAPTWIHWLCSVTANPAFVGDLLPFFLITLSIFNGVVVTWATMAPPWKYWLYWNNPVTYYIRSTIASVLHNQQVVCSPSEFLTFQPPSGETCASYAGAGLPTGYLDNPGAMADCRYCQYSVGDEFSAGVNAPYDFRWQSIGILASFCISNVILCYCIFYVMQIKGGAFVPGVLMGKLKAKLSRKH